MQAPVPTPSPGRPVPSGARRTARWTGALLLLGAVQFVVEQLVEELLWPRTPQASGCTYPYSPVSNAVSDLGGFCAGNLRVAFDLSVILVGLTTFIAASQLWGLLPRRRSTRVGVFLFLLTGLSAIGVGLFPEYTGAPHVVFAFVAFLAGNLGLLALGRGLRKTGDGFLPSLFSSISGVVGLAAIVLLLAVFPLSGPDGGIAERLIIAPELLWAVVFGIRLMRGQVPLGPVPGIDYL